VVFGQRSQLWWDIPVADSFELLKSIYSIPQGEYKDSLNELCELLELSELLKTPARQLSLGQRMRCEIAASLIHRPDILFLDEPTIGLDAVTKIAVRSFIKKINAERNTTVILTTHDMQDIDALCERVILIGRGKILLDGKLDEIKRTYSSVKKMSVEYSGERCGMPFGITVEKELPGKIDVRIDTSLIPVSEAVIELARSMEVTDINVREASAEEIVVKLYRELKIV
jgi:ABC-2 type transport system ATP-binding protein